MILDRVILASASPRRLELLASLGLQVDVCPSGYSEPEDPTLAPRELAIRHAAEKARAVPATTHMVVAADTVVDCDGVALGKPRDVHDAERMLTLLSGRVHDVHTAFALGLPGRNSLIEDHASTRVRFYDLSRDEISAYVATGEPMDKAGSYGIQGRAASLVEAIEGDFYTVMGFPLARFVRTIRRLGFSLPATKNRPN